MWDPNTKKKFETNGQLAIYGIHCFGQEVPLKYI